MKDTMRKSSEVQDQFMQPKEEHVMRRVGNKIFKRNKHAQDGQTYRTDVKTTTTSNSHPIYDDLSRDNQEEHQHNQIPEPRLTAASSATQRGDSPPGTTYTNGGQQVPRKDLDTRINGIEHGSSRPAGYGSVNTSNLAPATVVSATQVPFTSPQDGIDLNSYGSHDQRDVADARGPEDSLARRNEMERIQSLQEQYSSTSRANTDRVGPDRSNTFPNHSSLPPADYQSEPEPVSRSSGSRQKPKTLRNDEVEELKRKVQKQDEKIIDHEWKIAEKESTIIQLQKEIELRKTQLRTNSEQAISERRLQKVEMDSILEQRLKGAAANNAALIEQLRSASSGQQQALANADRELQQARQQLSDAHLQNDNLHKDLLEAQEVIQNLQYDFGAHFGESYFKETYQSLKSSITRWAEDYYRGKRLRTVEGLRAIDADLVAQAAESRAFVESERFRIKLVESYVWRVLLASIIGTNKDNDGAWWAGQYKREVAGLHVFFRPNEILPQAGSGQSWPRSDPHGPQQRRWLDYHRWRAMTTKLATPDRESSLRLVLEDVVAQIYNSLEPCLSAEISKTKGLPADEAVRQSKKKCRRELLDNIIVPAIELDLQMNSQLPYYRWKSEPLAWKESRVKESVYWGFKFDPDWMTMDTLLREETKQLMREGDEVGMLITPALLVSGDTDGQGLCDEPKVLEPAVVVPCELMSHGAKASWFGR